jgi:hypothetical protein
MLLAAPIGDGPLAIDDEVEVAQAAAARRPKASGSDRNGTTPGRIPERRARYTVAMAESSEGTK